MDYVCRSKLSFMVLNQTECLKWAGSAEGRLWFNLSEKVIRKPNEKGYELQNYIYEKFYCKGKLATSWGLTPLSLQLGYNKNGASNVSKLIKSLVKKGIIKKHKLTFNNKKFTVYEIGYVNKEENQEISYAYEYFRSNNAKEYLSKNF